MLPLVGSMLLTLHELLLKYITSVTFQFLRVEDPEEGVNDHKTCKNETRLYFCMSQVHWLVL